MATSLCMGKGRGWTPAMSLLFKQHYLHSHTQSYLNTTNPMTYATEGNVIFSACGNTLESCSPLLLDWNIFVPMYQQSYAITFGCIFLLLFFSIKYSQKKRVKTSEETNNTPMFLAIIVHLFLNAIYLFVPIVIFLLTIQSALIKIGFDLLSIRWKAKIFTEIEKKTEILIAQYEEQNVH